MYILDIKRSPIGKFGGSLSKLKASQICSQVIEAIFEYSHNLKKEIDEVILGNVLSAGIGQNPARISAMKAGIPEIVPATTINNVCGSGLKSITLASQIIQAGHADLVLAGGMENMSMAPFYLHGQRFGVKLGNQEIEDGMIKDGLYCSLIKQHMGVTAENIAEKYKISREEQDEFAYNSHKKATKAIKRGKFKDEIVPVRIRSKKGEKIFDTDEQPREDTTVEVLSKLRPVFKKDGTVTAGNASSINDGVAIGLVCSEDYLKKTTTQPLARIVAYKSIALDPEYMGMGAAVAVESCLKEAKMKKKEIDLWELNEAFAAQSVAVINELKINPEIVNINGGSIALGHPIGASGAKILATLVYELKKRKQKFGLASLCIGGGQGIAMIIENV